MRRTDVHKGGPSGRLGDCHRCGWRLPLTRVGWQDRRLVTAGLSLRWICEDCRASLFVAAPSGRRVSPATTASAGAKRIGYRSVA